MSEFRHNEESFFTLNVDQKYDHLEIDINIDADGIVQFRVTEDLEEYTSFKNREYSDFLINLYNDYSPTHSNFVNLTKNLITGSGFVPVNDTENTPELQAFLKNINSEESATEVLEKVAADFSIHNQAALFISYVDNNFEVMHLDVSKVRAEEVDIKTQRVKNYFVSADWSDASIEPVKYPIFDATKPSTSGQILFIKKHSPGNPYYSTPDWRSALNYILAERNLSVFHLNSIEKGFFPSTLIEIVGSPTNEQKQDIRKKFTSSFTGVKNTSKLVVNFIDDQNKATKINSFTASSNGDLFNTLEGIFIQKIATAHGGNPELAGIFTGGSDLGGDANKMAVSLYYFTKRVIAPYQDIILRAFNKITFAKGLPLIKIADKQLLPEDPAAKIVPQQ